MAQPGPSKSTYDWIVCGAGVAGLSAAALLARAGADVLVLEAINYPGGCASSYERDGFLFDVGATVFVGVDEHMPVAELCRRLDARPELLFHDPSLVAVMPDGTRVTRWQDPDRWIGEATRAFGDGQERFWRHVFDTSEWAYELTARMPRLPPTSVGDFLTDVANVRPRDLRNPFSLLAPASAVLKRYGLHEDSRFRRFVDEQLMITNQCRADDARWISAAMGLAYPNARNYSAVGGMLGFARWLEDQVVQNGGEVVYNRRVTSVAGEGTAFRVQTRRRDELTAGGVMTNLSIYDAIPVLDETNSGALRTQLRRVEETGVELHGAFTVYSGIADNLPPEFPLHWQVHVDRVLAGAGRSLFVSISPAEDATRAPEGHRALTISTHTAPDWWSGVDGEASAYAARRDELHADILDILRARIPELATTRFVVSEAGTPSTFKRYTKRHGGLVGGIPLDRRVFPFRTPSPVGASSNLLHLGDNFFPGQGIPGVVLGALRAVDRVLPNRGKLAAE